ncbi:MAG: TolB family protein, partial [Archangium sp.]
MKHWLVFAALSLTTLLVSCGPTKAECEASTCNGCCDASGTCQVGNSNFSCGSAGAQCMQCNFGNVCLGGQCLPSSVSGGGSGSTGGGAGSTGGGAATGGGAGSTGGGAGSTGGGAGSTGGGSATGGGAGSTGGGSGATGGGAGSTGGGAGTGGGTALPSFTSQLWYYGTISTTARRDVGRVLFPSQTPFPLNVPGSDIRSFHVNATGRMVAVSADVVQAGRFDLVTLNHDGTNVRTLYQSPAGSNVSYVRFSPNGQRISFEVRDTLGNGQVFVVPVSGGTHVNVTPPKNTAGDPT